VTDFSTPVVAIFGGSFCNVEEVTRSLLDMPGKTLVTDEDVIAAAVERFDISEQKIRRAFSAKTSVFNKFTYEKECSIACLKMALAILLNSKPSVVQGFSALLIPISVSHILRVCLAAETSYRVGQAKVKEGLSEKEALSRVRLEDANLEAWTETLFSVRDPWEASLYDIVVPMSQLDVEQARALIEENLLKEPVARTPASEAAEKDFLLAASVEAELLRAGHNVSVSAADGVATLIINKQVLMLSRLEEDLTAIAEKVPGVKTVQTRVGKACRQSQIYRKHNFEVPSKVLLVDDEREFVQTLSERLEIRDMGSAVAYDGESALKIVNEDEPEVMIIDLKMPGIDGIEVLRQVKQTRPEIEVIVLTGHGSEKDRKRCMELGAFAYLQKPVDIDQISETLKMAHEKIVSLRS
jgi:CheY-like chemotaxis protein